MTRGIGGGCRGGIGCPGVGPGAPPHPAPGPPSSDAWGDAWGRMMAINWSMMLDSPGPCAPGDVNSACGARARGEGRSGIRKDRIFTACCGLSPRPVGPVVGPPAPSGAPAPGCHEKPMSPLAIVLHQRAPGPAVDRANTRRGARHRLHAILVMCGAVGRRIAPPERNTTATRQRHANLGAHRRTPHRPSRTIDRSLVPPTRRASRK